MSGSPPASPTDYAAADVLWRRLASEALKGAPFERLVSRTDDGIAIEPLYRRAAGAPPQALRAAQRWHILGRIDHPEPAAAHALAQEEVSGGADGLHVVFAGAVGAYGFGLGEVSAAVLDRVLEAVPLETGFWIEIDAGPGGRRIAETLADLVVRRGIDPHATKIGFGIDPLGVMAQAGAAEAPWSALAPALAEAAAKLAGLGFAGPFCVADGRVVHAAGGSEGQELAFVLACALAYLRALEAGGLALDGARAMIGFRLAADADEFLTIAKTRALRRLWWRIEEACGLAPKPICIHAETAWRMMTRRDPWVNALRATVAAFSAGLAGADRLSVLPLSQAIGLPDTAARRLARNTQILLEAEAHLAATADPAAGSGAFEALTEELSRAAWSLLQELERAGGIWEVLQQGKFQAEVGNVRQARQARLAERRDVLVGTSDFADPDEAPIDVMAALPATSPAAAPAAIAFVPLPAMRLAEPFERAPDARP